MKKGTSAVSLICCIVRRYLKIWHVCGRIPLLGSQNGGELR